MIRPLGLLLCLSQLTAATWETTVPLEAARSAVVYVQVPGFVRTIVAEVGDEVAAGDTLALLADEELRMKERQAWLEAEDARTQMRRTLQLFQRSVVSREELEDMELEAEHRHIAHNLARLKLRRMVLTAPMAGIVATRHLEQGQAVVVRMEAFRLIDPTDLKAELFVPVDRLAGIASGQPVTASAVGKKIKGRVVLLSPFVDPASGTCRAVALFDGAGDRLRPGTMVRVHLNTDQAR